MDHVGCVVTVSDTHSRPYRNKRTITDPEVIYMDREIQIT